MHRASLRLPEQLTPRVCVLQARLILGAPSTSHFLLAPRPCSKHCAHHLFVGTPSSSCASSCLCASRTRCSCGPRRPVALVAAPPAPLSLLLLLFLLLLLLLLSLLLQLLPLLALLAAAAAACCLLPRLLRVLLLLLRYCCCCCCYYHCCC